MDPVQVSLTDEMREQVRRRRIDPRADAGSVRDVALEVLAEHERRSLTGAVRSLEEPERMVGRILADVSGLGPLQPLPENPTVEKIGALRVTISSLVGLLRPLGFPADVFERAAQMVAEQRALYEAEND